MPRVQLVHSFPAAPHRRATRPHDPPQDRGDLSQQIRKGFRTIAIGGAQQAFSVCLRCFGHAQFLRSSPPSSDLPALECDVGSTKLS
jgi:hypothetical protein